MSYYDIFLKLVIGFITIVIVINVSGKGNLAPTSASDVIQNYVLGGIIGGVIYSDVTLLQYIIVLLMWTIIVFVFKWIKTNNHTVKRILDGEPTTIILRGELDVEACRKVGLTAQDVAFKLRSQGVYQLSQVKRAVLEQNGSLIIVQSGEENPKFPVITDGMIHDNVLESIDKDKEWLLQKLQELGYEDEKNIFIAEYIAGHLNIVTYD